MPLLEINNLIFRRGDNLIVDNLNLSLQPGEIVCLLGPSGVGKTTLLKLIAGELIAGSGEIDTCGSRVGYLEQQTSIIPWFDVWNNLILGPRLLKEFNEQKELEAQHLGSQFQLSPHFKKMPEMLSGGMRRRVELGAILLSDPDILLLDEPTTGLDVVTQEIVHAALTDYVTKHQATALIVTHSLEEAARLASRILIVSAPPLGELYSGQPDNVASLKNFCMSLWNV
ncbi:ATP-binding cassette domain-containing protein [bacterium]|nr:ATP-binding cassette domain-containing protein [bacterium]